MNVFCCDCVERRVCRGICGQARDEHAFTAVEWERAGRPHDGRGKCKNCMQRCKQEKKCSGPCELCLPQDAFSDKQWEQAEGKRKCKTCVLKKTNHWLCVQCKNRKHKNEFAMWCSGRKTVSNRSTARCNDCQEKQNEEKRADRAHDAEMTSKP